MTSLSGQKIKICWNILTGMVKGLSPEHPDRTPDNSHKCLRQNPTNLGHFGPRGLGSDRQNSQLGWYKSDPGSDKEAHQLMEVRSTFGQGPLAEWKFFDELWELWVTMKWQMPGQQRQRLVGSVFGQIGPTGWEVRGDFGQKCPNSENFVRTKTGSFGKFWIRLWPLKSFPIYRGLFSFFFFFFFFSDVSPLTTPSVVSWTGQANFSALRGTGSHINQGRWLQGPPVGFPPRNLRTDSKR